MPKIIDKLVIGHKNPDTDSICSAICYANLKNIIDKSFNHIPARCGEISKETQFVLDKFNLSSPRKISDVRTQVSDMEIRDIKSVSGDISLKNAYAIMKSEQAVTLVITKQDGAIDGIVSVGDIAASNLDVYDSEIVSKANTPYKNIVETLDGKVICGDVNKYFSKGKVTIAANTPELMEEYISKGDLVITGNRFENQFFAIEMGVSCIVLCTNNDVNETVVKLAEKKGCVIISSPYDSYTVARLINQSMPIKSFMTSKNILTFSIDDYTNEVKEVMGNTYHRFFPVHDGKGKYIGQISKRNFIAMENKPIILVDHNEKNQAVDGIEFAEITEIIDHHRLGNLETANPVYFRNQPLGCTATIIYQLYRENDVDISKEIAGALCSAIISDTLMFRSPTCTPYDKKVALELADIAKINVEAYADEMFTAGSDIKTRTNEEIFYQDYKDFAINGMDIGIGQISLMNSTDINELKKRIGDYMEEIIVNNKVDVLVFMLTSIIEESTTLLFKGKKAKNVITEAFGDNIKDDSIYLKNIVSRKKQLVPELIKALQK
ncbi:MAG: putative manganese-dependent inorganic diphosphatase [Oscillospiraceae bacterium]